MYFFLKWPNILNLAVITQPQPLTVAHLLFHTIDMMGCGCHACEFHLKVGSIHNQPHHMM